MISVIIPTRNRADLLQSALLSLQFQTLSADSFEILVIDNGSTDNTKEVVESCKVKIKNLKYFYEETPGLHVGRNLGLEVSQGDILSYLDDDVTVQPGWAKAIIDRFSAEKNIVLIGGPCLPDWEIPPPDWINNFIITRENGWELGQLSLIDLGSNPKRISALDVYGCNFSIRKNVLLELGGFHPDGMPEKLTRYRGDGETYVSKAIDAAHKIVYYEPLASVRHHIPSSRLTKKYFFAIARRGAVSFAYSLFRSHYCLGRFNLIKRLLLLWIDFFRLLLKKIFYRLKDSENQLLPEDYYCVAKWHIAVHFARIFFSGELKKWVLQSSYFREDPCPYWAKRS